MEPKAHPPSWRLVELGELGAVITGKTPSTKDPSNFGGDILFVKPGDLDIGGRITTTVDTLTEKGFNHIPQLPANSVMVTCIGNLGKVGITSQPSATNQQINSVIPNAGVDHNYLYHYLCSIKSWLEQEASATTVAIINKGKFSKAPVLIPPLAEQQEIAKRLDELLAQVDTLKTRLDAIPAILKRFRQSVLAAAVSGRLTEEWRGTAELTEWQEGVLGEFVKKPSYGTSSKSQKEGLIPVLRMGNLQDGKLDWTDLVFSSDADEIEKYRLEKGDVLFNRTNSPELVGKTSIYRGEREAIYAGYLIRVQCMDELNPEFLNYHLNSPRAKDYCRAVKSDGVSQSNINAKKLASYPINKPPISEQIEIVRRVDQLFTFADQIEQRVKDAQSRVNHLTQSILAKAFRGELTAEWREQNPELISGDNSAEALLERIREQRANVKPLKRRRKRA